RFGAAARGVDRRVLQQQQPVRATGHPGVTQLTLQLPGVLVADPAQPAHLDRRTRRTAGTHGADGTTGQVSGRPDRPAHTPARPRWCRAGTRIRPPPALPEPPAGRPAPPPRRTRRAAPAPRRRATPT